MKEITMPSFGSDMEQGVLTEWQVKVGDEVKRGDPIAVIETHKGAIELDAFDEGAIAQLLVQVGEQTPVGQPIAMLAEPGEEITSATTVDQKRETAPDLDTSVAPDAPPAKVPAKPIAPRAPNTAVATADFQPATPAARKLAAKSGILLSDIKGTGPGGAITLVDVEGLLAIGGVSSVSATDSPSSEKTTESVPAKAVAQSGFDPAMMREAISATVTRSKREIPHYYLSHTLDISKLEQHLAERNADVEPLKRTLLIAPLLSLIARALIKFPQLNGHYRDGQFVPSEVVDMANAVNLRGGGLVMPVLRQVDKSSMEALMQQLQAVTERAKQGSLKFSDLDNPSFTVTSIGDRGVESILGVIYPPQVAIVGLGCPRSDVVVVDGEITVSRVMTVTLSADHRVTDGHYGSRFLMEINKRLQKPEALWNE
ncbi:dihydrolipoamide acetyltransferase family protein [Corallincola platygyrae]|uniref:Dihydrolipoamide acetyltransferase component of pyruvate dehydrogenase complex n=1 Tax=Corallincola platygyrae TaxID=1193278 RepID=A0ABW4XI05_9GAMM